MLLPARSQRRLPAVDLQSQPSAMFERYTEGAHRALFFARYALSRHGAGEIAPEHLLLGLMPRFAYKGAEGRQVTAAATLLEAAGLDNETVQRRMTPRGTGLPVSVEVPFSASAQRCLSDAAREADQMNVIPITTGHLLLGVLQADGTAAAALLHDAGLRIAEVRVQVRADVAAGVEGNPLRTS